MKKLPLFVAACLITAAATVFGQTHTQSISFDDGVGLGNAGTYNSTDSFGVDLYLTYNGYESYGFSLWFATTANAAPFISLTGMTYGKTFSFPTQDVTFPIFFTQQEAGGLYGTPNPSDLGSLVPDPTQTVPPGTYFVGHLSVSLANLPPGVYTLQTDATNPHASEVTDMNFDDNNLPVSAYTITVVPEPGTFALVTLGSLGMAAVARRRRRGE
jgi:hypothetical protein